MRIAVFGAAGNVGSRTVKEALSRGHEVRAIVRNTSRPVPERAERSVGDVTDPKSVEALAYGADVAVCAVRAPTGSEHEQAGMMKAFFDGMAPTGVRLLIVGGAATLRVPDTGGLAIDDPRYVQPEWRSAAVASAEQHEACRNEKRVDWTYLSPPADLVPGVRTGRYRLGEDELLTDEAGNSQISMEDLAVALIDEAERPRYRGRRFTVAY